MLAYVVPLGTFHLQMVVLLVFSTAGVSKVRCHAICLSVACAYACSVNAKCFEEQRAVLFYFILFFSILQTIVNLKLNVGLCI